MALAYSLAKGEKEKADEMATGEVDNAYKEVPSVFVDVIEVTKDNMVDTVIKDGFHKLDDVYKNMPKDQRIKSRGRNRTTKKKFVQTKKSARLLEYIFGPKEDC